MASAVLTLTLCASCLSGCKGREDSTVVALKKGQTFQEATGDAGAPCDGFFIDVGSAQRIAIEYFMEKATGEIE